MPSRLHFALMFMEMGIIAAFLHTVWAQMDG